MLAEGTYLSHSLLIDLMPPRPSPLLDLKLGDPANTYMYLATFTVKRQEELVATFASPQYSLNRRIQSGQRSAVTPPARVQGPEVTKSGLHLRVQSSLMPTLRTHQSMKTPLTNPPWRGMQKGLMLLLLPMLGFVAASASVCGGES